MAPSKRYKAEKIAKKFVSSCGIASARIYGRNMKLEKGGDSEHLEN